MAPCAPTAADAAALRAKCEVGASFAMLLQLKGFLKDVYQLSDKKCGEYAPADTVTSRTTEKLTHIDTEFLGLTRTTAPDRRRSASSAPDSPSPASVVRGSGIGKLNTENLLAR